MNPEQQPDRQKEIFLEHLRNEIWQAAQEMGAELTEEELRVAWQGPRTEEEKWVPFKLGDREARLSVRAMDFPEDSRDRRVAGAQALILKAAAGLRGAPETSAECLQYARDVWEGKYVWDEKDIPQPTPRAEEIEAEKDARKAA